MFNTLKNKLFGLNTASDRKSRSKKGFCPSVQGLEERISLTGMGSMTTITNAPPSVSPTPTQWSNR